MEGCRFSCATKGWVVAQGGWRGCKLLGKGSYLYGEKCPQIITNLHKLICAVLCRFVDRVFLRGRRSKVKVTIIVQVGQRTCFNFRCRLATSTACLPPDFPP